MNRSAGVNPIPILQKKWNAQVLIAHLVHAVAAAFVTYGILETFTPTATAIAAGLIVLLIALLPAINRKKIGHRDVVRYLNEAYPDLEESAQLLLVTSQDLNTLQKFQLRKVESRLISDPVSPPAITRRLKRSYFLFAVALLLVAAILIIPGLSFDRFKNTGQSNIKNVALRNETKPTGITGVEVRIKPPAYTHLTTRQQQKFSITAQQGAEVTWTVTSSSSMHRLQLIFNDGSVVQLVPSDAKRVRWVGTIIIKSPGFYQVKCDTTLSELYPINMVRDQPPVITVHAPKPSTVIEYGRPPQVQLQLSLTDDYGIAGFDINATTASGSGEAVKFKEQRITFNGFLPGNNKYLLQKRVGLPSLGMQPGDELYLYFTAKDSYNQEKRSDVYIIRLEDTTQLMSWDGLMTGPDMKPEFFRSERQIIIETEQLLKDRDTISVESFNRKSEDLGIDQKLLRLRYGKFLGEESDAESEEEAHHNQEIAAPASGSAGQILDQYSHKHDNAEDASFFDAKTKKQLLATLSEMWKAELQLRTRKPKDALPYEYKALRLLKELQQQTRVYVSKTGTKTTPLKPESRLTGDLAKINEPLVQQDFKPVTDRSATLRKALGVLEQVRNGEPLPLNSIESLEAAGLQLGERAVAQPAVYLAALQALRRIIKKQSAAADINLAGSALQLMIRAENLYPRQSKSRAANSLSARYFKNLMRKNE